MTLSVIFAVINGNAEKCNKSHSGQGKNLSHEIISCSQQDENAVFFMFSLENNKPFFQNIEIQEAEIR